MTIQQSLKSINAYPVPLHTIQDIADARGLNMEAVADIETRKKDAFRLAKADVLKWLSQAPNVSQSGVSYSFTESERKSLRRQADDIYQDCGEVDSSLTSFGYKGELF